MVLSAKSQSKYRSDTELGFLSASSFCLSFDASCCLNITDNSIFMPELYQYPLMESVRIGYLSPQMPRAYIDMITALLTEKLHHRYHTRQSMQPSQCVLRNIFLGSDTVKDIGRDSRCDRRSERGTGLVHLTEQRLTCWIRLNWPIHLDSLAQSTEK